MNAPSTTGAITLILALSGLAAAEPTGLSLAENVNDFSSGPGEQFLEVDYTGEGQGDIQVWLFELAPDIVTAGSGIANQGRGFTDIESATFPNINHPEGDPPTFIIFPLDEGESVANHADTLLADPGASIGECALFFDFPAYGIPKPLFNGGIVLNEDFYLGLKFAQTSEPDSPQHYGWLKVRLNWDGPGGAIQDGWEILAAGYESDPETDIAAGAGTLLCPADTNGDGQVTPADFGAWIAAFNSMSPACDQNGDSLCTPADFGAWITNFNAGC